MRSGSPSAATAWACIAFFWLRVLHAGIMLAGGRQIPLRPVVFTLAWICRLVVAVEVLRLG